MNIQNFINEKFGSIRVIIEDGTEWFIAKDVAKCLGYTNSRKAIGDHVDDEYKKDLKLEGNDSLPSSYGGLRHIMVINESGVYQLIMSSKMPGAKEFQRWVFEEVLPSIRETGAYIDPSRDEIRNITINIRTTLTDNFDVLMFYCHWITPEQAEHGIRSLTSIANKLAGINTGGRDNASSKQLIKLGIIETSFSKTLTKKLKKYITTNREFTIKKLIEKCEEQATFALNKAGYKTDKIYITTNW